MISDPLRWFRNSSISRKLFFVVSIMAFLIAGELYVLYFTIKTLSSTRAFVAGEGLYSKAEKDAVFNLRKYANTLDENDFRVFQQYLKVTLGDRQARIELEKENPDLSLAYAGLMQGRNNAEDIPGMVKLYQRFRHISFIDRAISIWVKGDSLIDELEKAGNNLHGKVAFAAGYKAGIGIEESVKRMDELNRSLTLLEDDFSYTLGEGSRWMEHLIFNILFLVGVTVVFTGLLLTISISSGITRGLNELVRASEGVAQSDFTVMARIYSIDEIGRLAGSFNQMVRQLSQKTEERKQTEEKLRRQKELYETLVIAQSEMGEGVVITEGPRIVFVNNAICDMYGYTEEELLALPSYMDLVTDEQLERLRLIRDERIRGEVVPDKGETSVRHRSGRVLQISYARRVIITGDRTQTISIIRDITEQKKAEKKITELASIVETSDDAIISKSVDGHILSWNRGAEKQYGYSAEEVLGMNIAMLSVKGHADDFQLVTARAASGEHIEQFETVRSRKDGRRIHVSLTVSPISDEMGRIISISIISRDISRRKRAEAELKRKSEELTRSNTELEQFAYIASHDLREPLRTITSYVQLLDSRYRSQLDGEALEFITFAVDGAKRMDQLIQDLLTFSRVGNAKLEFARVSVQDTLDIVLVHLQDTIEREKAEITWDVLPEVKANQTQLVQLFQNLIGNAIKFRGTEKPRIHIAAKRHKQGWLLSVKDNGIGIDPKYSEKIFIIFQRLHARGQYEGTGIGLAICKKIVERHGGEIWLESEPGQGSVFNFTIGKTLNTTIP
jgi:PAS domain S-box-containing protein